MNLRKEQPEMRTEHPLLARSDGGLPLCVEDIEQQLASSGLSKAEYAAELGWTVEQLDELLATPRTLKAPLWRTMGETRQN
jgi:hypothetical protein